MKNRSSSQEAYDQLSCYTLEQPDPSFIHQNIVDAFTAQMADDNTKLISISFALIGLYLNVEKNYSGRQVQLAHMKLARTGKHWPLFDLPYLRGEITVFDVLNKDEGKARDNMIQKWCVAVWQAYKENREKVIELIQ